VETFLSGPGLARDHGEPGIDAAEIARRAAAGDRRSEEVLARYEDRLARALAVVIDVIDPDVVVLGGGLSRIDRLYANVPAQLSRWVFSDVCTTPIVPPVHGDSSGVRGAAWLWGAPGARL
jgi:fructokinase